jgi:quinoprotein glucose dehydrogenase
LPAPFARQDFEITNRSAEARASVLAQIEGMEPHGAFVPPSLAGQVIYPGFDGGGEWGGGAFDPETGLFYVNSNEVPWMLRLIAQSERTELGRASALYQGFCASCHGVERGGSGEFPALVGVEERLTPEGVEALISGGAGRMPGFAAALEPSAISALAAYVTGGEDRAIARGAVRSAPYDMSYRNDGWPQLLDGDGYPGSAPPWGALTAIDLNSGEHVWRRPLGEYPELAAQGLTDTGSENYGGPVVTAGGVLFIGATVADRKFRAFDKRTGELLWEFELPAAGLGTPAVYEAGGRQFVVTPAGGPRGSTHPRGASYVAFALPVGGE